MRRMEELIDILVVVSLIVAMLTVYKIGKVRGFKEGSEYVLDRFKNIR